MKVILKAMVLSTFIGGCSSKKDHQTFKAQTGDFSTSIKYAKGFSVQNGNGYKRINVHPLGNPSTTSYSYMLAENDVRIDSTSADAVIRIPIKNLVCTSTTHVPLLDYLGETEKLIGFPTTSYISSEKMRQRIADGKVTDLGTETNMNLELISALNPSLLMGYTVSSDLGQLKKIRELGIPVVINAEYLESHPLGRAEWIKFMALFFGKENVADSVFKIIEEAYHSARLKVADVSSRPTVFTGIPYGGIWYLPGGGNYSATLFKDAGYRYLWEDDPTSGSIPLHFEAVYSKAIHADFWIGVASTSSLNELAGIDERFKSFQSFQSGKVFSYNKRLGSTGGNEFLELGYLRPDWIISDLVSIAHPETMQGYELVFYRQIK